MFKSFILLALTIIAFMQIVPVCYAGAKTMTLIVSATLPEHIMENQNIAASPFANNPYQLSQTETVIRNNRSVLMTTIVVP